MIVPRKITYKVNKRGCHICTSHKGCINGYCVYTENKKSQLMHRYIWETNYGKIPDGLCVCHDCDTPNCINPKHLWIGTHADNMKDKKLKGRSRNGGNVQRKGVASPLAKLTGSQVHVIRKSIMTGVALARRYGVSTTLISFVRNERKYNAGRSEKLNRE